MINDTLDKLMKTFCLPVFLSFILAALSNSAGGKNIRCDSLVNIINTSRNDTVVIKTIFLLADHVEETNPDSALLLYNRALKLSEKSDAVHYVKMKAGTLLNIAILYAYKKADYDQSAVYEKKAREIFKKYFNDKDTIIRNWAMDGLADIYNLDASVFFFQGKYSDAIINFEKSIDIYRALHDEGSVISGLGNLGVTYQNIGDYVKAVEYIQQLLRYNEKKGNRKGAAKNNNNLAIVYIRQKSFVKARAYCEKAIAIAKELDYKEGLSRYYGNIGVIYYNLGLIAASSDEKDSLFDIGAIYINDAIKLYTEQGFKEGIADCYNNLALIHIADKKYDQAIASLKKGLEIRIAMDDREGEAMANNNMALIYNEQKQYLKAFDFATQAYKFTAESGTLAIRASSCQRLADALSGLGRYSEAVKYLNELVSINDSLFSRDKTDAIANMETRYQTEKKQQEIEKQQLLIEKKDAEMQQQQEVNARQRLQRNMFIAGFVVMLLLAFLIYRNYKQKKKANIILTQQNEQIRQQKEEIIAQRDEIEAQRDEIEIQRDIAVEQRDIITEQKNAITSSINYALRIQQSVLPSVSQMNEILGQYFLFFRPRDIVSGDFYFVRQVENKIVFAVADCTGHGVPGAFMSMLGISGLHDIVVNKEILTPGKILDKLRDYIVLSLQQQGMAGEQKDGMDISLCVLDRKSMKLQFSGANNPIYIIKSNPEVKAKIKVENGNLLSTSTLTSTLIELKGDSMPVAIHIKMDTFTTKEYQVSNGDMIYLCSDGFQDQFGGPSGRKFMAKNLRKHFEKIAANPLEEQGHSLKVTLEEWMGKNQQIDDITILGVRVC